MEALQPCRSLFRAQDTAPGASRCGLSWCGLELSFRSRRHLLWSTAQWTQLLWPGVELVEQWTQPLEHCTMDTAVVAWRSAFGAVDSAFGALYGGHSCCGLEISFWSSGLSLWSIARWTQLLWPDQLEARLRPDS